MLACSGRGGWELFRDEISFFFCAFKLSTRLLTEGGLQLEPEHLTFDKKEAKDSMYSKMKLNKTQKRFSTTLQMTTWLLVWLTFSSRRRKYQKKSIFMLQKLADIASSTMNGNKEIVQ